MSDFDSQPPRAVTRPDYPVVVPLQPNPSPTAALGVLAKIIGAAVVVIGAGYAASITWYKVGATEERAKIIEVKQERQAEEQQAQKLRITRVEDAITNIAESAKDQKKAAEDTNKLVRQLIGQGARRRGEDP